FMLAITRQPRLLVKTRGAAPQGFKMADTAVRMQPLFTSIQEKGGLAAAAQPNWYIMSAQAPGEEENAWDLCHQLLRSGFGVAGAPAPEFCEPDLEQRWVFGSDTQHAFAAASTCDKPADPDTRLPVGNGFFWFRDDLHSELEQARTAVGQP